MQNVVRSTLSLTFVIAAARVVFNVKGRMTREATWELELKGDLTKQRRVEAVDKLLSVLTLLVASVFGLQAVGLDGALLCQDWKPGGGVLITGVGHVLKSTALILVVERRFCTEFLDSGLSIVTTWKGSTYPVDVL